MTGVKYRRYYIIAHKWNNSVTGIIETNKKRQEENRKKIYGYDPWVVLPIYVKVDNVSRKPSKT